MPSQDSIMEECTAEWSLQALESNLALFIDCRIQNEFMTSHIPNSINIFLTQIMQRRITKPSFNLCNAISTPSMKVLFSENYKLKDIILYDSGSSDVNSNHSQVLTLVYNKLKEEGCKVRVLAGGFQNFKLHYPQKVSSPSGNSQSPIAPALGLHSLTLDEPSTPLHSCDNVPSPPFPVKVIHNLYLGNAQCASDVGLLRRHNIRYILNVTSDLPNAFSGVEDDFNYKQIPITDHWSENLCGYFPSAFQFIDEGRDQDVGVLVHCLAGISRSVTVTVAYLMSRQRMSLNDAYDFVKRIKPNISPNFNFMGQLLDFELTLKLDSGSPCSCKLTPSECTCSTRKMFFMTPTQGNATFKLEPLNVR